MTADQGSNARCCNACKVELFLQAGGNANALGKRVRQNLARNRIGQRACRLAKQRNTCRLAQRVEREAGGEVRAKAATGNGRCRSAQRAAIARRSGHGRQ